MNTSQIFHSLEIPNSARGTSSPGEVRQPTVVAGPTASCPRTRAPGYRLGRGIRRSAAAVALSAAAAACPAAQGVALQYGTYGEVESIGMQWMLPVWYRTGWSGWGGWRLTAHPEVQLNRHRRNSDELYQGGAFAVARLSPARTGVYPYLEAGIGVNLISSDHFGPRRLSTHFQFGELVGVGLAWGAAEPGGSGEISFGVRFSHYSNARIKTPNDGVEALQFALGYRF